MASVREYAILYVKGTRTGGVVIGGGNAVLATGQHALDGPEHTGDLPIERLSTDETDLTMRLRPDGAGGVEFTLEATGGNVIGTLTPDGSPVTVSSGTSHRAFPGVAWLTGTHPHAIGDKFLLVYRDGTSHLAGGLIEGIIGTITDDDAWTYSLGSPFTIEDVANDLRCEDGVSVLDVGGTPTAVIAAREYDGTDNQAAHILVCDDSAATMTSSSTWTRHEGPVWDGTDENLTSGYVMETDDGNYLVGVIKGSSGVFTAGVAITPDVEEWDSPTFVTIGAGYTEVSILRLSDGSLRAHLRNTASNAHHVSVSTDNGLTWTTPVSMFTADGFPMVRELPSSILLTVYRSDAAAQDTAYRYSVDGGATWTAEVILDATGNDNSYATLLFLGDNHTLCIYGIENNGSSSTDSDLFSQVFTDSTIFDASGRVRVSTDDTTAAFLEDKLVAGSGVTLTVLNPGADEQIEVASTGGASALDDLSDVTIVAPAEDDHLQYIGGQWVNNARYRAIVTNGFDSLVWEGDDLVWEWSS